MAQHVALRVAVPEKCLQHTLPVGSFTLDDLPAQPSSTPNGTQIFWVPRDRFRDLVAGEQQRGECCLVCCHKRMPPAPKRTRQDNVQETFELQCCFGPADYRKSAGNCKSAAPLQPEPVLPDQGKPEQQQLKQVTNLATVTESSGCTANNDVNPPSAGCSSDGGPCSPAADAAAAPAADADVVKESASPQPDPACAAPPAAVKKRRRGTTSIKVGCQFALRVSYYRACPDWACVRVKQRRHLDQGGRPCHGPDCPEAAPGTRLAHAAQRFLLRAKAAAEGAPPPHVEPYRTRTSGKVVPQEQQRLGAQQPEQQQRADPDDSHAEGAAAAAAEDCSDNSEERRPCMQAREQQQEPGEQCGEQQPMRTEQQER
ncbi:hypothetical protein Agub_g9374, partial [Astrephomene gubernaculifera]